MKRIHIIGRLTVILAGLAGACLALSVGAASAALAGGDPHGRPGLAGPHPEPPGWNKHPPLPAHVHAAVTGGMPGWQIALIVAGAALLAAGLTMIAYRTRAARRRVTVSAT